jgi:hypothetical protein
LYPELIQLVIVVELWLVHLVSRCVSGDECILTNVENTSVDCCPGQFQLIFRCRFFELLNLDHGKTCCIFKSKPYRPLTARYLHAFVCILVWLLSLLPPECVPNGCRISLQPGLRLRSSVTAAALFHQQLRGSLHRKQLRRPFQAI